MRVLQANIDELRDAAIDYTFTPIIGAACSTLDHKGEPRHRLVDDVQLRARTIASQLDEAERRYLDELIDFDRARGEAPPIPEDLLHFYTCILRLDRCASLLFKTAVTYDRNDAEKPCEFLWKRRSGSSLPRSLSDWQAPITRPHCGDFLKYLTETIDAAAKLHTSTYALSWRKRGLGADGIHNNLLALKQACFDTSDEIVKGASLNLMDLVWIGNLFWHTLRFDLPYYPTTGELAFQLSLHTSTTAGSSRNAPPLLAQAAQALGYPHVLSHLTEWFQGYSACSGTSEFYKTIARWLKNAFVQFTNSKRTRGTYALPLPLVFTTNYDQEIERALENEGCPYHVVFPVDFIYHSLSRSSPFESPEFPPIPLWLMKTADKAWHYAGQTSNVSQSNQDGPDPYKPACEFIGPLVVKLHGSPLETVPELKDIIDNLPTDLQNWSNPQKYSAFYRHRIIMTESDYLTDLRRRDLPRWILERMQTEVRNLFFLGQSISDWNIRLRLADAGWVSSDGNAETMMLNAKKDERRPHRFAVNRASRYFDAAFMGPLNIAQLEAELERVQAVLADTL